METEHKERILMELISNNSIHKLKINNNLSDFKRTTINNDPFDLGGTLLSANSNLNIKTAYNSSY